MHSSRRPYTQLGSSLTTAADDAAVCFSTPRVALTYPNRTAACSRELSARHTPPDAEQAIALPVCIVYHHQLRDSIK